MDVWSTIKSQGVIFFWQTLLSFFNIVFIFCGLMIIGIGWWIQISLQDLMKLTNEFLTALPLLLMIAGFIIIIIACSASVCMKKPCLLITYATCLIAFFVLDVLITIMVLVFRDGIYDAFGTSLNMSMVDYTDNARQQNQMDEIQIKFECCGYFGAGDWLNAPVHQIPPSCCRKRFCDPTKAIEIFSEGCMNKLYMYLNSNLTTVLSIAVIAAILPLCGAIISFCLAYHVFMVSYQPIIAYDP